MLILLKLIQKNKFFLVSLSILIGIISIIFNLLTGPKYAVYLNIAIKKINRLPSEDYQYDDFYALQAVNMVSDTVQTWFKSKAVIKKIDPLEKTEFYMQKLSSQNLELTLRGPEKQYLIKTENNTKEFLKEYIENLLLNSENDPSFSPEFLPHLIQEEKRKTWQIGLAGALTGFLLGMMYLITKKGLAKKQKPDKTPA